MSIRTIRNFRIVAAALALAACSHAPVPPPAVETRVVKQTVEVPRPCGAKKPKRPAPLATPLPGDPIALIAMLGKKLAEYAGSGGYADRAEDALEICTRP